MDFIAIDVDIGVEEGGLGIGMIEPLRPFGRSKVPGLDDPNFNNSVEHRHRDKNLRKDCPDKGEKIFRKNY